MSQWTNTRPSIVAVFGVEIGPAATVNLPPEADAVLNEKGKDQRFRHPLRRGGILVPGEVPPPPVDEPGITPGTAGLPDDVIKALTMIRITDDIDRLAGWGALDQRPEIVNAVKDRISALRAAPR